MLYLICPRVSSLRAKRLMKWRCLRIWRNSTRSKRAKDYRSKMRQRLRNTRTYMVLKDSELRMADLHPEIHRRKLNMTLWREISWLPKMSCERSNHSQPWVRQNRTMKFSDRRSMPLREIQNLKSNSIRQRFQHSIGTHLCRISMPRESQSQKK